MPTYEYACRTCGEHLEVVQGFREDALTECPACGGPLRKVFGNIGISFKGSGFYKTDSRSSATGGKSKSADGGGDTKTETKSESTSDTKSTGDSKPAGDTKSDKPTSDTKAKSTGSDKAAAS